MIHYKDLKKSFSIAILTMVAVGISALFSIYQQNLNRSLSKYDDANIEDFTFIPNSYAFNDSSQPAHIFAGLLADEYDFSYETAGYKIIEQDGITFRALSAKRTINRPVFRSGTAPEERNEIAVDINYAKQSGLDLGGQLHIQEQVYRITGFFTLSDYISPLITYNTSYNAENQGLVLFSHTAYQTLNGKETLIYKAVFNNPTDNEKMESMLGDNRFSYLMPVDENPMIMEAINTKKNLNIMVMVITAIFLGSTALITLLLSIGKNIEAQKGSMGILKAMGYSNMRIAVRYTYYGLLVLLGAVLGYMAAWLFSGQITAMMNSALLLPDYKNDIYPGLFLGFTILPSILSAFFAYLSALYYLREPALNMIIRHDTVKINKILKHYGKKDHSFIRSASLSVFWGKYSNIFFIFFTGFLFTAELMMTHAIMNIPDELLITTMDGIQYENNVRLLYPTDEPIPDTAAYYSCNSRLMPADGSSSISCEIVALNPDYTEYLTLKSSASVEPLHPTDGIIINQWFSTKYDLKTGDTVNLTIGEKSLSAEITGVDQALFGTTFYTTFQFLKKYDIIQADNFNGYFTGEQVSFEPNEHLYVTSRQDMEANILSQKQTYTPLSMIFILISAVMGSVTIQLAMKSLISSNKKYLSLMKAYGYGNRDCNYVLFHKYRITAYIGGIVGFIYTYFVLNMIFLMLSKGGSSYVPVRLKFLPYLIIMVTLIIIFELILNGYKRKVQKTGLQEVMSA